MQRPLISRLHPGRHAGRVERVMPHEVRQQGQQFGVAGDAASHGQQGGVAGQRVAQLIGADPGPVFQEGLHLFVRKAVLVVQDGQEDQAAQDVFGQGLLRLTAGNRLPERIGQSLDALDDADVGQTGGLGRGDDRLAVRASWRQAQSAGIGRRGPQVDLRVQAFLPHGAPFLALVGAQFFLVVDQQHRAALALERVHIAEQRLQRQRGVAAFQVVQHDDALAHQHAGDDGFGQRAGRQQCVGGLADEGDVAQRVGEFLPVSLMTLPPASPYREALVAASCNSARPISSGDFKPKQEAYRAVFAAGSVSRKESHRCVLPAPQRPLRPSTWPLLFSRNWVRAFLLAFKFIPELYFLLVLSGRTAHSGRDIR